MMLTLLSLYLLLCVGCGVLQRKLIYFPRKIDPKVVVVMAAREGFSPWTNNLGSIIGWKIPATRKSTGSVLIVHGNAGSALDRGYFAQPIHDAASMDVYVLEYPGYGARDGSPSEKSFLAAADQAFAMLSRTGSIYIVSESLGTGVAAHLAKTHHADIAGLALFVPYDDFASLAQDKMPFLPISLILIDRFHPSAWLKEFQGPIQFVLAENDQVIPTKFGQRLHDGYAGSKKLQITHGAGHNDVSAQSPEWWKTVFSFFEQHR